MVAPAGQDEERKQLLAALRVLNEQIEAMNDALAQAQLAREEILIALDERTW